MDNNNSVEMCYNGNASPTNFPQQRNGANANDFHPGHFPTFAPYYPFQPMQMPPPTGYANRYFNTAPVPAPYPQPTTPMTPQMNSSFPDTAPTQHGDGDTNLDGKEQPLDERILVDRLFAGRIEGISDIHAIESLVRFFSLDHCPVRQIVDEELA